MAGLALLAVGLAIAAFAGTAVLGIERWGFVVGALAAVGLAFLPWKAWPELARTLFLYALAARILVMLAAIYGEWGTHYDVLPPDPPSDLVTAGPLARSFWIGLLPPATFWYRAHGAGGDVPGRAGGGGREAAARCRGGLSAAGPPRAHRLSRAAAPSRWSVAWRSTSSARNPVRASWLRGVPAGP